ncbi:predicted protein [Postia placenta Mad-698-R]|nr:predicted protein [Postia placenta Mad-698-R]
MPLSPSSLTSMLIYSPHVLTDIARSAQGIAAIAALILGILWLLPFLSGHSYDVFGRRPRDKDSLSIPDGPLGLPIVGSFPFLTHYPELTLHKWRKRFGPLYSMWLGNQLLVIVSDPGIAKDLMVTNGAVFSSRKEMFIKSQIIFAGRGITATPYNDRWRKHRRIATGWLNLRAVIDYSNVLDYEATVMMMNLYLIGKGGVAPINPQPHAGRCSLNNMLTIVFGTRTDSIDHPLVNRALMLSREFMAGTRNCTGPVSNLVDFVTPLQWFPTRMSIRGKRLHKDLVKTYGGMIKDIERRMNAGETVPDCLAKTMILAREEELDHLDMAILASAFMIGGVETTASIMQWFSALIPAYPDIQLKAQAELDRVVGRDRLPTIEDEANLPFCHAIIKEVERCHNPFWLGTPHVASEDSAYEGYYIPKDTVVILNTYSIHHDPERHVNPHDFDPERYIKDSTNNTESANLANPYDRDHWMFGAGRRICPGMIVAEREIWLAISRMLWAFDMVEIPGEPIDLKEYDGLSGRSPVPFRIKLIPRHENVAKVLGLEQLHPNWQARGEAPPAATHVSNRYGFLLDALIPLDAEKSTPDEQHNGVDSSLSLQLRDRLEDEVKVSLIHPTRSVQKQPDPERRPFRRLTPPPEVCDMIVDHLQYDPSALANCLQACESCFQRCRKYLPVEGYAFKNKREVFLVSREDSGPGSRSDLPGTPLYAIGRHAVYPLAFRESQSVIIEGEDSMPTQGERQVNHLGSFAVMIAAKWSEVTTSLTIRHGAWSAGHLHPDVFLHLAHWRSIKELKLAEVTLPSASVFGNLIAALSSSLLYLTLSRVTFLDASKPLHLLTRSKSTAHRLPSGDSDHVSFVLTIHDLTPTSLAVVAHTLLAANVGQDPWIRNLRVVCHDEAIRGCPSWTPQGLPCILRAAGETLRSMRLTLLASMPLRLSFAHNTRMVSLRIDIHIDEPYVEIAWLQRVLSTLPWSATDPALRSLALWFWVDVHVEDGHVVTQGRHCNGCARRSLPMSPLGAPATTSSIDAVLRRLAMRCRNMDLLLSRLCCHVRDVNVRVLALWEDSASVSGANTMPSQRVDDYALWWYPARTL